MTRDKTLKCHACGWEGNTNDLHCPICLKEGFQIVSHKEALVDELPTRGEINKVQLQGSARYVSEVIEEDRSFGGDE